MQLFDQFSSHLRIKAHKEEREVSLLNQTVPAAKPETSSQNLKEFYMPLNQTYE